MQHQERILYRLSHAIHHRKIGACVIDDGGARAGQVKDLIAAWHRDRKGLNVDKAVRNRNLRMLTDEIDPCLNRTTSGIVNKPVHPAETATTRW